MKSTPREKAFETGTPLTFLISFLCKEVVTVIYVHQKSVV